jgi:hypothetical protein
MSKAAYHTLLNLPAVGAADKSLATLTGKSGLWRVEIVINATQICYLGSIPVPASRSQQKILGIVDIATVMLHTSAAVSSSANTVAVSMVEVQTDPVHRGQAF